MSGISNSTPGSAPKATLLFVVVCLSFRSFSLAQSSSVILTELHRESGWKQVALSHGDMQVFNKEVEDSGVPAIMVRVPATVSADAMASAIEGVEDYTRFLQDVYLERSDLLERAPQAIDGYHLLDLPFISNRHYVYRMAKVRDRAGGPNIRYDWILMPRHSEYSSFLDSMDALYGSPVYLGENVGSWEIEEFPEGGIEVSYRLFVDPAGWVPDFLMARANRLTAPRMVQGMIQEAVRREKK